MRIKSIQPVCVTHTFGQVLDDSTDWATRQLVDDKVAEWRERGIHVEALRRTHRQGYKAGALHKGMEALQDCKYVAVFDADFRPEADFLVRVAGHVCLVGGAGFALRGRCCEWCLECNVLLNGLWLLCVFLFCAAFDD